MGGAGIRASGHRTTTPLALAEPRISARWVTAPPGGRSRDNNPTVAQTFPELNRRGSAEKRRTGWSWRAASDSRCFFLFFQTLTAFRTAGLLRRRGSETSRFLFSAAAPLFGLGGKNHKEILRAVQVARRKTGWELIGRC